MNLNDDEGLEAHADFPGERWFPSNGTDGDCIHAVCEDCQRDKVLNGTVHIDDIGPDDRCEILGRSFCDEDSVIEWRRMPEGTIKCMAFLPMDG